MYVHTHIHVFMYIYIYIYVITTEIDAGFPGLNSWLTLICEGWETLQPAER